MSTEESLGRCRARWYIGAALSLGCVSTACGGPKDTSTDVGAIGEEIIGGSFVTSASKYPGMGALLVPDVGNTWRQYCAGTLIHPDWVLTAAHCFVPGAGIADGAAPQCVTAPETCKVVLRSLDWRQITEEHLLFEVILHPGFHAGSWDNDIALVHLNETATSPVMPLLTEAQMDALGGYTSYPDASSYTGESSVTIGWGHTRFNGPLGAENDIVRTTKLKESGTLEYLGTGGPCNAMTHYDEEFGSGLITMNMLCARSIAIDNSIGAVTSGGTSLTRSSTDACRGDSGGPLLLPLPQGGHGQMGIVSFARSCALWDYPTIYTRAANYLDNFMATYLVDDAVTPAIVPVRYGSQIGIRNATYGTHIYSYGGSVLADGHETPASSSWQICKVSETGSAVDCTGGAHFGDTVVLRQFFSGAPDPWTGSTGSYSYLSNPHNTAILSSALDTAAKWRLTCATCTYPDGTLLEPVKDKIRLLSLRDGDNLKMKDGGASVVVLSGGGTGANFRIEQREYRKFNPSPWQ